MGVIRAPEPLGANHVLQHFDCGRPSLNEWLKKKAAKAQRVGGSSRTFVVCSPADQVVGYYALATGSINREDVPGKVKKNMPNPIPVILLGRLAVDQAFKGKGLGAGLLKDALLRVINAAEQIGVRAVLVHALDDQAKNFYLKHGFYESPTNDLTLMITVEELQRTLQGSTP